MATDCIAQITFNFDRKRKPVVAAFDAEHASSDGGAILPRACGRRETRFQSRPRVRYVTQLVGQHGLLKSATRLKHAIRPLAP